MHLIFSHPQVLLKLFSYCVKVKINRQQLVKPEMNTLNVMLGTLNLVSVKVTVFDLIYQIQIGVKNINQAYTRLQHLLCSRV